MESVILRLYIVYLFHCLLLIEQVISSTVLQLKVEECTKQEVINVGESTKYEVVWNGEKPSEDCKYQFIGTGGNSMDKYKICVDVLTYFISDCNVALRYDTLVAGKVIQTEHRCGMSPPTICNDENQKFDIELSSRNRFDTLNRYPSSFTLSVTAVKTFDHTIFAWTIAGIVIGAVAVIIIVIVVIVLVYKYHRKRQNPSEAGIYNSKKSNIYKKKSHDNAYTIPIHIETSVKRAPSFSSISSDQFENNQGHAVYLPYTDVTYDKTAHIY